MFWTATTTLTSTDSRKKRAREPEMVNYDTALLDLPYSEPSITVPADLTHHTPLLLEPPLKIPPAQFPPLEWNMARKRKREEEADADHFATICINGYKRQELCVGKGPWKWRL